MSKASKRKAAKKKTKKPKKIKKHENSPNAKNSQKSNIKKKVDPNPESDSEHEIEIDTKSEHEIEIDTKSEREIEMEPEIDIRSGIQPIVEGKRGVLFLHIPFAEFNIQKIYSRVHELITKNYKLEYCYEVPEPDDYELEFVLNTDNTQTYKTIMSYLLLVSVRIPPGKNFSVRWDSSLTIPQYLPYKGYIMFAEDMRLYGTVKQILDVFAPRLFVTENIILGDPFNVRSLPSLLGDSATFNAIVSAKIVNYSVLMTYLLTGYLPTSHEYLQASTCTSDKIENEKVVQCGHFDPIPETLLSKAPNPKTAQSKPKLSNKPFLSEPPRKLGHNECICGRIVDVIELLTHCLTYDEPYTCPCGAQISMDRKEPIDNNILDVTVKEVDNLIKTETDIESTAEEIELKIKDVYPITRRIISVSETEKINPNVTNIDKSPSDSITNQDPNTITNESSSPITKLNDETSTKNDDLTIDGTPIINDNKLTDHSNIDEIFLTDDNSSLDNNININDCIDAIPTNQFTSESTFINKLSGVIANQWSMFTDALTNITNKISDFNTTQITKEHFIDTSKYQDTISTPFHQIKSDPALPNTMNELSDFMQYNEIRQDIIVPAFAQDTVTELSDSMQYKIRVADTPKDNFSIPMNNEYKIKSIAAPSIRSPGKIIIPLHANQKILTGSYFDRQSVFNSPVFKVTINLGKLSC